MCAFTSFQPTAAPTSDEITVLEGQLAHVTIGETVSAENNTTATSPEAAPAVMTSDVELDPGGSPEPAVFEFVFPDGPRPPKTTIE